MKLNLLYVLIFVITNMSSATIYITEVINNTNQDLRIGYNVPAEIRVVRPVSHFLHESTGKYNLIMPEHTRARLCGAYLPNASGNDSTNVISLSFRGSNGWQNFALLRNNNLTLERINSLANTYYTKKTKSSKATVPILERSALKYPGGFASVILDKNLNEDASYTLEVNQKSPEVFRYVYGCGELIVQDSFEIIFTRNDIPGELCKRGIHYDL